MTNLAVSAVANLGGLNVVAQARTSTRTHRTPAQPHTQPVYRQDAYAGHQPGYAYAAGMATPVMAMANDYRQPVNYLAIRIAQKLDSLGVRTADDLLRRADTPFKRATLTTMLAAFDSSITKPMATAWVNYWVGQADLMRTGMSLDTARLMQKVGITDGFQLSRYAYPMDRMSLYGALSNAAIYSGYRMPMWQEFSLACDNAQRLPLAVRW